MPKARWPPAQEVQALYHRPVPGIGFGPSPAKSAGQLTVTCWRERFTWRSSERSRYNGPVSALRDTAQNGSNIRVQGKGQSGRGGGPPGDLYIVTRVQPHPYFERKGDNLYCEVPISVTEAALGAKIDVPTVDGKASMRIPPETSSGKMFRLRGMGVPRLKGSGRGDQFVTSVADIKALYRSSGAR
ncbi:MAG TPA: J domain-containing protein [Anaerolineales bacterium]|nr:J domain-containing protein [Anaerolineales bacterium]